MTEETKVVWTLSHEEMRPGLLPTVRLVMGHQGTNFIETNATVHVGMSGRERHDNIIHHLTDENLKELYKAIREYLNSKKVVKKSVSKVTGGVETTVLENEKSECCNSPIEEEWDEGDGMIYTFCTGCGELID